jgi:hypothetical protein
MPFDIHALAAPALTRFRRRRMKCFVDDFGVSSSTRVLDVGGNSFNWQFVDVRPRLTFVNIGADYFGHHLAATDRRVVADGCDLPFGDQTWDIVFCNSVIEHLGSPAKQQRLASEIERVGISYFVQTPNYWFPIEPHYLAPGVQFVPRPARGLAARWLTPWGWIERPSSAEARASADEIQLLTRSEMAALFPNGRIASERAFGLDKSLIAVRIAPRPSRELRRSASVAP